MESPSDKYLIHNKDNIFMAFRPVKVEKMYFYNRQRLTFDWETDYGLATHFAFEMEKTEPTAKLLYEHLNGDVVTKIRQTSLSLGFDYRPGQSYINSKQQRMEVNLDAPEFKLRHTMGIQSLFGSQLNSNLTELSAYKRIWLGSWGRFDIRLSAGAQWNKVPFPLLIMPPVNTSYFEHQGTFNLMENMEFLNDRYAQFNLAWNLEGKVFNRIPLLKHLKWREYIAFKGMWGHLTDKNNPYLPQNAADPDLYRFPEHARDEPRALPRACRRHTQHLQVPRSRLRAPPHLHRLPGHIGRRHPLRIQSSILTHRIHPLSSPRGDFSLRLPEAGRRQLPTHIPYSPPASPFHPNV